MKKQLLVGSALLLALGSFSQNSRMKPLTQAEAKALRTSGFENLNRWQEQADAPVKTPIGPAVPMEIQMRSSSASAPVWVPFTSSRNIFGVLVSTSKPLQYNEELNAVSFVHRASKTYSPIPYPSPDPGATSGAIVAAVSTDWGNTWDSTCVWNDNTNWARYPQGGIYNPPGNSNLANSYIVATGPVTPAGGGWVGNFFASKQLNNFNETASAVPNAQQFIPNTGPSSTGFVDFARLDFTATDDGLVRSMGFMLAGQGTGSFFGVRLLKGTFNSGVFNWTGDSITPPAIVDINGDYEVWVRSHMAWNESGTTGYVVFVGARQGASGNNADYQPMVWKTTNSGGSWSLMSGINFNDTAKFNSKVLNNLYAPQEDSTAKIPFFWEPEGIDCSVDKNDRLHIVSTLVSAASTASVGQVYGFNSPIDGVNGYRFDHDSLRPLIYDFYETATGWDVAIVDTMTSERMGGAPAHPAYNENPWDADPANSNNKLDVDARIQVSRSSDGKFLVYTWSESDPQFTSGGKRWNQLPNIKTRIMSIENNYKVLPVMEDLTTTGNQGVKNKAHFLNTSPECLVTNFNSVNNTYTITLPVKVSNSSPLAQLQPNTHWYYAAPISFSMAAIVNPTTGISSGAATSAGIELYPNPAQNDATLNIELANDAHISVSVLNTVGQTVKFVSAEGKTGSNVFTLDLSGLSGGMYFVNITSGKSNVTQKLIVR